MREADDGMFPAMPAPRGGLHGIVCGARGDATGAVGGQTSLVAGPHPPAFFTAGAARMGAGVVELPGLAPIRVHTSASKSRVRSSSFSPSPWLRYGQAALFSSTLGKEAGDFWSEALMKLWPETRIMRL